MLSFFGLQIPTIPFLVTGAIAAIIIFAVLKKVVHLAFRIAAFGVILAVIAFVLMRH
ncbi:MAG TPA: hypothetical protein VHR47_06765 [Bacillota bacterium]|jgi:hypothetical protein|nr:hypothetical protein [Bacillota bacterium]